METNRDLINKMNNEEFAIKILGVDDKDNLITCKFCIWQGKCPLGSYMKSCKGNVLKWLSQEAPKESIYHKSDLKHKPILNGIPVNIVEDKTWYIHRTSEKRNCELYVFVAAEFYDKKYLLSTNETSGDKFERSYFTESDAIAIRDMLNEKRKGKRYLWVVSNKE